MSDDSEYRVEIERLIGVQTRIEAWCDAYPLKVFPEPDWAKAARVLKENGMTLDAISASNMRHVLDGVRRIIREGERAKWTEP